MERRCGYQKMINYSIKHQKTSNILLRWVGNISGDIATGHILKCVYLDEDENWGLRYKYHSVMYRFLNKPYAKWGTYYTVDIDGWRKENDSN